MARRRQRRPKGPPRCSRCQGPVVWFVLRGKWRTFEPRPVDGRAHIGGRAHPVEGKYAWTSLRDLTEDLMVRRECSSTTAQDEAYDMPWYVEHTCPPGTTSDDDAKREVDG
jgi:hypothetical protein